MKMLLRKKGGPSSVCPKTGKCVERSRKHRWLMWLFPITGLGALIWFLIRVIPKPSRATYPCQRIAFPIASSFVAYLLVSCGLVSVFNRTKRQLRQRRYLLAGICVAVALGCVWITKSSHSISKSPATSFIPIDPPNTPMGVAKGIHPGRVVWVHDPAATDWDGSTGQWWDDTHTDQNTVDRMLSKSIRTLTFEPKDTEAWDALFRHFNRTKRNKDAGYQAGEKIVVKINLNNRGNRANPPNSNYIDASPQMVRGLLRQLVYKAGVPQSAITVYDAKRPLITGSPLIDCVYNCCRPEFPGVNYKGGEGYPPGSYPDYIVWTQYAITYSVGYTGYGARKLPKCVLDADYMINMAILKRHDIAAGVTLCFKNHFGTIGSPVTLHNQGYWQQNWGMDAYDLLVDITGHKSIGGKTVLYIIDGLYGGNNAIAVPTRWISQPFNNDWPSSVFVSQDPVAIDSVGLDFLRTEWTLFPNADNYLHEAALADDPPSGTFYDPEHDGTRLESLGVHEHWNNPITKKYSRNLDKKEGNGIELLKRGED